MNNINEILNKIKEMDYNKETCIAELINYNPEVDFVEPMDQMAILRQVCALAEENNICIEKNMEEIGGLGFFVKLKKVKSNNDVIINEINDNRIAGEDKMEEFKINNNIEFEDEETKIEYQKYLDEINEYNRKIANGEKPEKDLSAITEEFKQKFNVSGSETNSIEDKNFNELIEKLNKSLDSKYTNTNLSFEEQIDNIDKRIEELNNLEDNDKI